MVRVIDAIVIQKVKITIETNAMIFDLIFGVRRYDVARTKSEEVAAWRCDLALDIGKVKLSVKSNDRNSLFVGSAVS
jgi:hypothetical protein